MAVGIPTFALVLPTIAATNSRILTEAKTVLGWNPQKTSYEELINIMAKHDRELAKKEKAMKNA